jgi:hypothetical protein
MIIFINCKWVDTRWQWLFYMYTKYDIVYYYIEKGGLHEKHVVALGKLGNTSAFAFSPRETKKNLCRGGRS